MYLIVFGSIVGYSAYVYAMDRLPVAIVSQSVRECGGCGDVGVAVLPPFGTREALAIAIIFAGVAVVKRYSHPPA